MTRISTAPIFDTCNRKPDLPGPQFEVLDEDGLYAAPLCIDCDVYGDEIPAEWEATTQGLRLTRFQIGGRFFGRDDACAMTGAWHVRKQEAAIADLATSHDRARRLNAGLPADCEDAY